MHHVENDGGRLFCALQCKLRAAAKLLSYPIKITVAILSPSKKNKVLKINQRQLAYHGGNQRELRNFKYEHLHKAIRKKCLEGQEA